MPASAKLRAFQLSRKKPRASGKTAGSISTTSGMASGVVFMAGSSWLAPVLAPVLAQHPQQILPVAVPAEGVRLTRQILRPDIAHAPRHLLGRGDRQALTLFDGAHEIRRVEQRVVRARVEPREAAAERLDAQVAAFEIGAVDVGDLQFAARRRLQVAGDADDAIVVEIEAGDGERSEEHTSELQSLMRSSYAVFCLTKTHKNFTI